MAGVEIRSTDPAAEHLEQYLPLARPWVGKIGELEPRVLAGDRPHAGTLDLLLSLTNDSHTAIESSIVSQCSASGASEGQW